jgi:hypothetical protein
VFRFPPVGFLRVASERPNAVLVFLIFLVFSVCCGGVFLEGSLKYGPPKDICAACFFLLPCWILLVILMLWTVAALERAEGIVTPEALRVTYRNVVRSRTWQWRRPEIEAVGVWGGLWVVAAGKRIRILRKWKGAELPWVGDVVRRTLSVPESVAPKAGELAVVFDAPGCPNRTPGILQVSPGRMTLRHGFATHPPYRFRATERGPLFPVQLVRPGRTLVVIPQDIICRPNDPEGSVLQMEPTGSRVVFKVWCDDPEALPLAVARFWGSDDH